MVDKNLAARTINTANRYLPKSSVGLWWMEKEGRPLLGSFWSHWALQRYFSFPSPRRKGGLSEWEELNTVALLVGEGPI